MSGVWFMVQQESCIWSSFIDVENIGNKAEQKMAAISNVKNGEISNSNHTSSREKLFPKLKRKFDCNICDRDFMQKSGLDYHIKAVHEGHKPHECAICNSKFTTEQYMKNHKSSVHEGKRPYKCSICDATFAQNSGMNTHIKNVHEGKRHQCKICDTKFVQKRSMLNHIAVIHAGKKES